ncbi:aldolase [Metabacillus halosaccharovorans]|uniref:aldolase n=1 Tax=Metabacillus halosaccharovorans TaxID=930124 RepID=UPI00373662C2
MDASINKRVYKAFGLKISSQILLPEIPEIISKDKVDIVVKIAELSSLWEKLAAPSDILIVKENLCLFKVPKVAKFLIEDGTTITVSPSENSNEDQIRLYVLGSCMGVLLMQRRILPLHGSAISIDGKAYAIIGDSGAGKSTLASAFLKKGFQLLSDDVIPIHFDATNVPMVTPAYPQQKLWLESLNEFGMKSDQYRPIFKRVSKFAVPVSHQFAVEPLPLAGVFELVKSEGNEIVCKPIENLQRLHTLFNHTYRNFLISRLGLMEWHFSTTAKICEHIKLNQLQRPTSRFTVNELTDFILTTVTKGEKIYG